MALPLQAVHDPATDQNFRTIANQFPLAVVPTGALLATAGSSAPAGFLLTEGQEVSRTTYATLWRAMGSPNTGDGSTTFNVPTYSPSTGKGIVKI